MHILFLTDNFPPEVNAPASRTFEHAREWVLAGHQVTVITCAPNFPEGKVYAGYKNRCWQSSYYHGIRLIRVWSYITANQGFLKRILDYLSFMGAASLAGLLVRKVDVVIGTSPQFFTVCAAYLVGKFKRIPYVFELRDIWPESITAVGAMQNSRVINYLKKLELFLYQRASLIIPVTESFKHYLVNLGIAADKITVVSNGVDLLAFQPRPRDEELALQLGLAGKFVLGYIGTHGMAHGLEIILNVAEQVAQLADGDRYRFLFLGNGSCKADLLELARKKQLHNVLFVDSVAKNEVSKYWSLLDVAIIHLRNLELFTKVIPSKLFECMGMGIPVLHGVAGESASIVEQEQVGLVFSAEDEASLLMAIVKISHDDELYAKFQHNARNTAHKFDRKYLAAKMLQRITRLGTDN
jgi:glycosyltransferase involved in cell wall biosynthesis